MATNYVPTSKTHKNERPNVNYQHCLEIGTNAEKTVLFLCSFSLKIGLDAFMYHTSYVFI